MKFSIKFKRKIHQWIYGWTYHIDHVPSIVRLQYKATKNIKTWKIKYITRKQMYKIMCSGWFLVNSHYPNPKILMKNEIGGNVLSRTRYILKK